MPNRLDADAYLRLIKQAREVFTPFTPVQLVEFFQGRLPIINQVAQELDTPGRHVILYGDRGVGKTSLAGLIPFLVRREPFVLVRCSAGSSFDTVFAEILGELGVEYVPGDISISTLKQSSVGISKVISVGKKKSRGSTVEMQPVGGQFVITPQFVATTLDQSGALVIIDEYDRFSDPKTNTAVADVIKHLSDGYSKSKVLVVGVATSVGELIGSHASIGRCLAEVHLPRMNKEELDRILEVGFQRLGVEYPKRVANRVVDLSDGYPHFTHLMGLKLCEVMAERCSEQDDQALQVLESDYPEALKRSLNGSEESLRSAYREATVTTKRKTELFRQTLDGMAISDDHEVQVNDLVDNVNQIYNINCKQQTIAYHLGELVRDGRGCVLVKPREGYYKFKDPKMRAFVRMSLEQQNYELFNGQMQFPFMRQQS